MNFLNKILPSALPVIEEDRPLRGPLQKTKDARPQHLRSPSPRQGAVLSSKNPPPPSLRPKKRKDARSKVEHMAPARLEVILALQELIVTLKGRDFPHAYVLLLMKHHNECSRGSRSRHDVELDQALTMASSWFFRPRNKGNSRHFDKERLESLMKEGTSYEELQASLLEACKHFPRDKELLAIMVKAWSQLEEYYKSKAIEADSKFWNNVDHHRGVRVPIVKADRRIFLEKAKGRCGELRREFEILLLKSNAIVETGQRN